MTSIRPLTDIIGEFEELIDEKDDSDEWYVLNGRNVGEYSVHTAEKEDGYDEAEQELPPEDRDATENVDGYYQIGTLGWAEEAFEDDCGFVEAFMGRSTKPLDTRVHGLIVVHESMLSEEAIEVANSVYEGEDGAADADEREAEDAKTEAGE